MSGFSSFDAIDDDFERAEAKPKYASEATEKLGDGDYEVEITAGIPKEGDFGPVVTILMVVLTAGKYAGWKIEKTYFLTKKGEEAGERIKDEKRVAELKSDLATIGFDVGNWSAANKRPFGAQLKIACETMKGCRLKIRKKQNGEYANIYMNKRLSEADGKPATFGPNEMVASATSAAPSQGDGFETASTPTPTVANPVSTAAKDAPW